MAEGHGWPGNPRSKNACLGRSKAHHPRFAPAKSRANGYEIIKAVEEHSSGIYSPSPGMVYPAATYLEELGYTASESEAPRTLPDHRGGYCLPWTKPVGVEETLDQLARFGRKLANSKAVQRG